MPINNLGVVIGKIYRGRGMTQGRFAEKLKISVEHLSRIENGHRKVTLKLLNKLEKVLKIPASILVILGSYVDPADMSEYGCMARRIRGIVDSAFWDLESLEDLQ